MSRLIARAAHSITFFVDQRDVGAFPLAGIDPEMEFQLFEVRRWWQLIK